jgi:hypothetical protein
MPRPEQLTPVVLDKTTVVVVVVVLDRLAVLELRPAVVARVV